MKPFLNGPFDESSAQNAIEIAHRVWWVGRYLVDDPFQCHVYLLEHGDQSVLFDPGSALTVQETLRKIDQIIPFKNIRYFVCHHQDPDIAGAMPLLDSMVTRDDACLVTHWRAMALLKHLDLKMPFWLVDENDWRLDLGDDRIIRFGFTPYAHFPGAFVSFDEMTGVLFSSDLFGGFTEGFKLVAQDMSYLDAMRPFHEHYIPGRDFLQNAMMSVRQFPITCIAPQHGSIIPEKLVGPMIDGLMDLECGLYLLSEHDTSVRYLMDVNAALREFRSVMMNTRDFPDIARMLSQIVARLMPLECLDFWVNSPIAGLRVFTPSNGFRGEAVFQPPLSLAGLMEMSRQDLVTRMGAAGYIAMPVGRDATHQCAVVIPLGDLHNEPEEPVAALAVLTLKCGQTDLRDIGGLVRAMSAPLQVAIDREILYQDIESERARIYDRAIRDQLTGLYSRMYMQETMIRMMDMHDRDPTSGPIALILIDIDHFKLINDTFGHVRGDEVLSRVGRALLSATRPSDLPVRLGGEEFGIFTNGIEQGNVEILAERLRKDIQKLRFPGLLEGHQVTASFGIAVRQPGESMARLLERADEALYDAKRAGRNRVCTWTDYK